MRYMTFHIGCVNTCPGLLRADYSSPDQAGQGKVREEAEIVRGTARIIIVSYSAKLPVTIIISFHYPEIACKIRTMSI